MKIFAQKTMAPRIAFEQFHEHTPLANLDDCCSDDECVDSRDSSRFFNAKSSGRGRPAGVDFRSSKNKASTYGVTGAELIISPEHCTSRKPRPTLRTRAQIMVRNLSRELNETFLFHYRETLSCLFFIFVRTFAQLLSIRVYNCFIKKQIPPAAAIWP